MSYAAAIDQLSAMTPELHTQPGHARRKFSLAEIGLLLEALGNPHRRFPSVLIAGTNGKGSTAATLASILRQSVPRTGLYTSPHLTRPNERIRVNGHEISDDEFARLYFRVHDSGQALVFDSRLRQSPSFFETLTAMAFLHFAESAIDIAVLEVGMGGRLDATNIVDPLLSIVTDISLDHMEWLGPTISDITREKAGILRPNGTLVTLPQHPDANQVLGEIATGLNVRAISAVPYMPQSAPRSSANAFVSGHDSSSAAIHASAEAFSRPDHGPNQTGAPDQHAYPIQVLGSTIAIASPLHGDHQHRNVALAITAAVELATHHGFPITSASIAQGVRSTHWPGRLEVFSLANKPSAPGLDVETWEGTPSGAPRLSLSAATSHTLAPPQVDFDVAHSPARARVFPAATSHTLAPPQVVLDVAHNPAGAWALRAALRSEFGLDPPERKAATLLFGCLRDKPLAEMAQILFPLFEEVIFAPIHRPRATPSHELLAAAEAVGVPARAAASVEEAHAWAGLCAQNLAPPAGAGNHPSQREEARVAPRVVVVAGSVYLVGEVRPLLLARSK